MSEWKRYKLSDLYEMSSGISSTKEQAGHGSPFLSFSVVFNNYFLPDSLIDLMDTTDGDKQKYSINEGDIFLTRTSETVDELAMSSVALKDYPEASFSGFLKRLRPVDKRIVYPKFMAFYLRSPLFRRTIINNTVMTLRASFNEAMFSYLEIMLPDFDTQKKIGDFLYSLEKKKQTNNQINQELETMAKTLYDYWFIQFDFPDQNGNPYKSSGGKMVYHPELKREIPEGWGVESVKDFESNIITGKTPSRKNSDNFGGKIPFITIGDIRGNTFVYSTSETLTDLGASVQNNKYLPQDSLCVSCIATVGEIGFTTEPSHTNQQINSIVFEDETNRYYLYFALKNYFENANASAKTGNTFANMNKEDFSGIKIIFPNKEIKNNFHKITETYFSQIKCLQGQNQQLTQLRDWLLPMLMNGQVKVE